MDGRERGTPRDRYWPAPATAWLWLSSAVAYAIGLAVGSAWFLPCLVAVPAWSVMVRSLRRGQDRKAIASMLAWAGGLVIIATVLPLLAWDRAETTILHGAVYRDEMWRWLKTGVGTESVPREFVPQHLAHLGVFVISALVSGGLFAILLGSVLMGYMGFYVASLMRASSEPWLAGALGWHPWSLLRVAAFVVLGVVLAAPLLRPGAGFRDRRALLTLAGALLVLDLALKALLAERWRRLLLHVV